MKLFVDKGKLVGGKHLNIDITKELLEKYLNTSVVMEDIEFDIDEYVSIFADELHLNHRYGDDRSLLALAILLECMNGVSIYTEFEENLSENTPFNDFSNGFVMFILCQLEEIGIIHDTKYSQLTEKGKVLLWLLRQFEFPEDKV